MSSGPAGDFSGILTASGYREYIEDNRRHDLAEATALREAASVLRRGIIRAGKRYLMGMDVKLTARRVCRPLEHAADCKEESARAFKVSYVMYLRSFESHAKLKSDSSAFDPTK